MELILVMKTYLNLKNEAWKLFGTNYLEFLANSKDKKILVFSTKIRIMIILNKDFNFFDQISSFNILFETLIQYLNNRRE